MTGGPLPLVTLFTDASHCSETRIAAFAAWAKFNGEAIRHAALFKEPQQTSTLAEGRAIVNGLHMIGSRLALPGGARIIAQTDCLTMIHTLARGRAGRAREVRKYRDIIDAYLALVEKHRFTVQFRHVSAHKGTVTTRNAVNSWCDQECRRLMRAGRTSFMEKTTDAGQATSAQDREPADAA